MGVTFLLWEPKENVKNMLEKFNPDNKKKHLKDKSFIAK